MSVYIEGKPAEYWLRRTHMKSFDSHISFFSWDFIFAEGDTIRDKYHNLYETIETIIAITKSEDDKEHFESYIMGKNGIIGGITTVFGYEEKVDFQPKYEQMDEVIYCGHLKAEKSPGFHVYEDKDAPEDKILIHTRKKISILNIFNYPMK